MKYVIRIYRNRVVLPCTWETPTTSAQKLVYAPVGKIKIFIMPELTLERINIHAKMFNYTIWVCVYL